MTAPLDDLATGGRLLLDGGMGQELVRRGIDTSEGRWSAQALLDSPQTVRAVHNAFMAAGAQVLTTNTYATTRRRFPEEDTFQRLNQAAGELAREAADKAPHAAAVAGSLPPLHGSYRPDLVPGDGTLEPAYREQAEVLRPYVDLFLCETMSTAAEAAAAARGAAATGKPVWVSWTLAEDGRGVLRSGESIADAVAALGDLPVAAVLVNCSTPESVAAAMPQLAAAAGRPFGAYANAFQPIAAGQGVNDGRDLPDAREDLDPAAYAEAAAGWLDAGARIVGGCCEVGPAHIAELRRRLFDTA